MNSFTTKFLATALWLASSSVLGQIDATTFEKYFCNTEWVPIYYLKDTIKAYDDLFILKWSKEKKLLIKEFINSEEFEEISADEWNYADGILQFTMIYLDEEGEFKNIKLEDVKITSINQDILKLKIFNKDGTSGSILFYRLGYFRNIDLSAYETVLESPTSEKATQYLMSLPFGKYTVQVQTILAGLEWSKLKTSSDIASLEKYAEKYNNIHYADSAMAIAKYLSFEKAIESNSIETIQKYLYSSLASNSIFTYFAVEKLDTLCWAKLQVDPDIINYEYYYTILKQWQKYSPAHLPQITSFLEETHYQTAITENTVAAYLKYIQAHNSGKHILEVKDRYNFAVAVSNNTVAALKEYLKNNPTGIYISTANEKIKHAYIYWGDFHLANCKKLSPVLSENFNQNISNGLYNYKSYITEYPHGEKIEYANNAILELYQLNAYVNYLNKNLSVAKTYYKLCLEVSPQNPKTEEWSSQLKQIDKQLRLKTLSDRIQISYEFGKTSYLGFGIGTYNLKKIGVFYWVKGNPNNPSSLYSYNSKTQDFSSNLYNPKLTGEIRYSSFSAIVGITKRLAYPIFGYMGIGYNDTRIQMQTREYQFGQYTKTNWVRDTDATNSGLEIALGLQLSHNKLALSGGISIVNFRKIYSNLGIGIIWAR